MEMTSYNDKENINVGKEEIQVTSSSLIIINV